MKIWCIVIAVLSGIVGYRLHPSTVEPHRGIWIEFQNLQHAIDSASKLGGSQRGFVVCMQSEEKIPYTLWNPGVSIIGDVDNCAYRQPERRKAWMEVSEHAEGMTISSLTVDGASYVIRSNTIAPTLAREAQ